MPNLYYREDIDTHLALFPDLKAHMMLALRHLAWCHPDDGVILTIADPDPEHPIMSIWCATCEALEAQIAITTRAPTAPHVRMGTQDRGMRGTATGLSTSAATSAARSIATSRWRHATRRTMTARRSWRI